MEVQFLLRARNDRLWVLRNIIFHLYLYSLSVLLWVLRKNNSNAICDFTSVAWTNAAHVCVRMCVIRGNIPIIYLISLADSFYKYIGEAFSRISYLMVIR